MKEIAFDKIFVLLLLAAMFFSIMTTRDNQQMENRLALSEKNLTDSENKLADLENKLEFTKVSLSYWTNLCQQQEISLSEFDEDAKNNFLGQSAKEEEFLIFPQDGMIEATEEEIGENKLRKASLLEVMEFLEEDQIDRRSYTEDYDCSMFTFDTLWNAMEKGIIACPVELKFNDSGHSLMAFLTSDADSVFFEPQEDMLINSSDLVVGRNYCEIVGWNCDWNDTISRIEIAGKCR